MIAADDAIHPDVVVKEIARHGTGDFIDVLANRESANFNHLGTGKAFPVETLRSKIARKAVTILAEQFDGIRDDENTCVQNDNGGGQDVLECHVAVWEPA